MINCESHGVSISVRGPAWLRVVKVFLVGVYLVKIFQSLSLVLAKPVKYMNSVSRRRDMAEILLNAT